jgi:hypothetical protein
LPRGSARRRIRRMGWAPAPARTRREGRRRGLGRLAPFFERFLGGDGAVGVRVPQLPSLLQVRSEEGRERVPPQSLLSGSLHTGPCGGWSRVAAAAGDCRGSPSEGRGHRDPRERSETDESVQSCLDKFVWTGSLFSACGLGFLSYRSGIGGWRSPQTSGNGPVWICGSEPRVGRNPRFEKSQLSTCCPFLTFQFKKSMLCGVLTTWRKHELFDECFTFSRQNVIKK